LAGKIVGNLKNSREAMKRLEAMVWEGLKILKSGEDLNAFGGLLDETWKLKKQLCAEVSPQHIDGIYESAIAHGALGGKLLGAGGTGFMVFYVPEAKQEAVRQALSHYLHVPFKFENEGSIIIYQGSAF
jgi:D-glycero-alpha-D-manno-heptose-7-phosphate kinase